MKALPSNDFLSRWIENSSCIKTKESGLDFETIMKRTKTKKGQTIKQTEWCAVSFKWATTWAATVRQCISTVIGRTNINNRLVPFWKPRIVFFQSCLLSCCRGNVLITHFNHKCFFSFLVRMRAMQIPAQVRRWIRKQQKEDALNFKKQ